MLYHNLLFSFYQQKLRIINYNKVKSPTNMVFPNEESLMYDVRLSSVGPGRATGPDVFHNPSGLDLAMKLHYLKIVYLFEHEAAKDLTITKIKEGFFHLFNHYFISCGRFRRSEIGRPMIKCNDCGARIIEAKCTKTIDEWIAMKDWPSYKLLVPQQVIGPELTFSPTVFFQVLYFSYPYTLIIYFYFYYTNLNNHMTIYICISPLSYSSIQTIRLIKYLTETR